MHTGNVATPEPGLLHNLPIQPDELLGREDELATAKDAIMQSGYRLLTLLGPGGIGKTRLALGIGSLLAGQFDRGSWFVDLTRTRDAAAVDSHILRALGVKADTDGSSLDTLIQWLETSGEILIILDNFEHVVGASSAMAHVLETCPGTRFIVTSREPLRLTWEQRLVVPPLAVPDLLNLPPPAEVAATAAVALFMRHARAINPQFAPESHDLQAVAELCVRLEGVPLAIELAATRANVLSPASILERLDDPQTFLRANIRNAPERHQSIQATLDWSFDLLTERERAAFRRLGVFVGGFTFEAATEILAQKPDDTLEVLSSLVDKAFLIVNRSSDGGLRYGLRNPVRAYACERLELSGEGAQIESDHADYYRRWVEGESRKYRHVGYMVFALQEPHSGSTVPGSVKWADRVGLDIGNIDVAMHHFAEERDGGSLLNMAVALQWFWWKRGHLADSIRTFRHALDSAPEASLEIRAQALHGLGILLREQGNLPEARNVLEEAISAARQSADVDDTSRPLVEYGLVMLSLGRLEEARAAIAEALDLWESAGDRWGAAAARAYNCLVATMQGHLSLAETLGKEAARELYEMGDARSGMLARIMAAYAELLAAKHSEANDLLFASLSTARELEEPRLIAALLEVVARSLLEKGDADDAATLLGVCQAVRANGSRSLWGYSTIYDDALLETRSALPETESRERFSYGETIGLSDALDLAERALLAESAPPAKPPAKPASARGFLSPREQEVLQLVSLGRSNREIARNIYVSESTVKFHVTSILNKLGANTRTEAVSSAMRRGILSIKETDEAAI